jgi:hypothetical protein
LSLWLLRRAVHPAVTVVRTASVAEPACVEVSETRLVFDEPVVAVAPTVTRISSVLVPPAATLVVVYVPFTTAVVMSVVPEKYRTVKPFELPGPCTTYESLTAPSFWTLIVNDVVVPAAVAELTVWLVPVELYTLFPVYEDADVSLTIPSGRYCGSWISNMSHVAGNGAAPPEVAMTPVASAYLENQPDGSVSAPPSCVRAPVVVPLRSW